MTSFSGRSDAELWSEARRSPDAFAEIFRRHVRAVHAYCARRSGDLVVAEDLTSVVFLEAWRKRKSVELQTASALPWLLGVATNVQRNSGRSMRRHRAALSRMPPMRAADGPEEATLDHLEAQRQLRDAVRALDALTADERDVLVLVAWSRLTYDEAAVALGLPIGTVRSRLSRARQKLKSSLPEPIAALPKEPS